MNNIYQFKCKETLKWDKMERDMTAYLLAYAKALKQISDPARVQDTVERILFETKLRIPTKIKDLS